MQYLTYLDETLSIAEWARRTGLDRRLIGKRIRLGWDIERILTQPTREQIGGKSAYQPRGWDAMQRRQQILAHLCAARDEGLLTEQEAIRQYDAALEVMRQAWEE
jgi:hypothetical protein